MHAYSRLSDKLSQAAFVSSLCVLLLFLFHSNVYANISGLENSEKTNTNKILENNTGSRSRENELDTQFEIAQMTTVCEFTSGPRAGQTQDYAGIAAPIPVGTPCHDGLGSSGTAAAE